jgi:glycosyltransferase involved in cell wall biosynthesis
MHAACENAFRRWLRSPDIVESIARVSRCVTVTGDFLAAFMKDEAGAQPHILPMMLNPEDYPMKETDAAAGHDRPLVLGWMGNAGNISRLASITDALRAVKTKIRLRVVSPEPVAFEGLDVESHMHTWSPETERSDLLQFDIGLLPIFDIPYEYGKFPFKLLQYAAAGLPIVATPIAIDPDVFVDGESILYAREPGEWTAAIERLAEDAALRERLGRNARRALEENYSFASHAADYVALLRSVR